MSVCVGIPKLSGLDHDLTILLLAVGLSRIFLVGTGPGGRNWAQGSSGSAAKAGVNFPIKTRDLDGLERFQLRVVTLWHEIVGTNMPNQASLSVRKQN